MRLTGLGDADFHEDELDHYYGAVSMADGGPPLLPSGAEYVRAIDYTRIVGLALPLSDRPETAARLPAAFFGIVSLFLIAGLGWMIGGPWCAVAATVLLAMYPDAVAESRRVRFYSYQLALLLGAMWAGWYAARPLREDPSPLVQSMYRRWMLLSLALLLFAMAVRVQLTSLSVFVAWLAACAWAGWADFRSGGLTALRASVPATAAGAALLGGALAVAFVPGLIDDLWSNATSVPLWIGTDAHDVRTYYWYLTDTYPILLSLGGVLAVVAVAKHPALAAYLLFWFGVPLALHSFVFAWKSPRFVLGAMPGLFLLTGLVVPYGVAVLHRAATAILPEGLRSSELGRLASGVVVAAVCLFAIASTPGFNDTRRIPPSHRELGWSAARVIIDSVATSETPVIGSALPFQALHYLPRVDFTVSPHYLDSAPIESRQLGGTTSQVPVDWYVGAPILSSPSAIEEAFPEADEILVLVDSNWGDGNIETTLRETLESEATELCVGRCLDLRLFLWRPAEEGEGPRTMEP